MSNTSTQPMSSRSRASSNSIAEWSAWINNGPAKDILASRIGIDNHFLWGDSGIQASSTTTSSPSLAEDADKSYSSDIDKHEGPQHTSLEDLKNRYSAGVRDLYHSCSYAVEAAVYFSILEAISYGVLIRSYGITKTRQAVTHVLLARLERLTSLAKDGVAQFVVCEGIYSAHKITQATGTTRALRWFSSCAIVRLCHGITEKVLGDDYFYRLAWSLVKIALLFVAIFQVLVVETSARVAWTFLCAIFKCFQGSLRPRTPSPSIIFSDFLVCLICFVSIPVSFASFYFQLEAVANSSAASISLNPNPSLSKETTTEVKPSSPRKTLDQESETETEPEVCPIVMEPLDGDAKIEPNRSMLEPEVVAAEDSHHYDKYASELETLLRAGGPPWNAESSPEEDSLIINTGQDAQQIQPAFLAGRFQSMPPATDMNALVSIGILLGLIQAHMAANGTLPPLDVNTPKTDQSSSLAEASPVGGESEALRDENMGVTSPGIGLTTVTASSSKRPILPSTGSQELAKQSQEVRVITTRMFDSPKKGDTISSLPDCNNIQPESHQLSSDNESLTEPLSLETDKTSSTNPTVISGSSVSTQNTHSSPENHTPQRGTSQMNVCETSSSSSSTTTAVSSVTTTTGLSEALSPSPSSSSLRSVTTAMKNLTLTATAPPFIPKRKLSVDPFARPTPLGVGISNMPPSDIWSPAPKVAVNICAPPPKKRRVRGRGRKALEAVAAAAMSTIVDENTAPSSRAMQIDF
ncbi:hypothetical protein CVT24_002110 [Panaeolus cyanescens]|uniref:Uncharacterized protein n=1 Tax=Panaeolus cyanescens TaxID=181874 RepID=A0A409YI61_9AGAR|nr:hypothetical protein CVT24_002110 [Panaeolus cyanescens]